MELEKYILFKINGKSCEFRSLRELDVSQGYLNGLKEQRKYIENIPDQVNIVSQKEYIKDIRCSNYRTICGLFINSELVGTAGVQLSTSFLRYIEVPAEYVATIGLFLFNKNYRGIGLGKTLVWAATSLHHDSIQAEWFGAGMATDNISSLRSFLSCGFKKIYNNDESYRVLLNYSDLKKPRFIKDEAYNEVDCASG